MEVEARAEHSEPEIIQKPILNIQREISTDKQRKISTDKQTKKQNKRQTNKDINKQKKISIDKQTRNNQLSRDKETKMLTGKVFQRWDTEQESWEAANDMPEVGSSDFSPICHLL